MAREIEEYTFPKFMINTSGSVSGQAMEEARSRMAHVDWLGRNKVYNT